MKQYSVTGMSCAACQARVEKAVSKVEGVESCSVSLLTNSMGVTGAADPSAIIAAVRAAGYGARLKGEKAAADDPLRDTETPKLIKRLTASAAFLVLLMYITMGHNMWNWPLPKFFEHNHLALTLTQMLIALIVMAINNRFFISGFKSLVHGAPNMDTLVALGSSVSFLWSLCVFYKMCGMVTAGADNMELMELYHNSLYFESAAMIPALITVGKTLESVSKGRTTNALKSLMRLAPRTASVIREGRELTVPVEQVAVGDEFIVRPGGSIPVDGVVTEGESAVDESALTGESIPVDKGPGSAVSAGTMNTSGVIRCRAVKVGADTTLSSIIRMVEEAAATKAPIARIADRVSGVFVPAVIGIAAVVVAGWLFAGRELSFALARGISVLVISCPCALGLATPVAIMVGNGVGARNGILFKTGEALETLGKSDSVALDKTGTVTKGEPRVTDVIPAEGVSEEELLEKACALERFSEHPLAKAVVAEAQERGAAPAKARDFRALAGSGVEAVVSGRLMHAGSGRFIRTLAPVGGRFERLESELASRGRTPLFFEEEGRLIGVIAAADVIKEDSPEAVAQLRKMGLEVVMLTGDNEKTAAAVGAQAGVSRVIAGVLPEGKESVIRGLKENGRAVMVGDGINDAPALTRADVGIAIGAGTDVAIESADVVLVNSRLTDVAAAVRLSRATLRNIYENLFWAFFYNIVCIPLAAGLFKVNMSPMIGAAAMSLSSFTVCMNALRLNLFRLYDSRRDRPRFTLKSRAKDAPADLPAEEIVDEPAGEPARELTVRVEGMMCPHCERTVKAALEALDFVESASASFETGEAVMKLSAEPDLEAVKKAVEAEDYEFVGRA